MSVVICDVCSRCIRARKDADICLSVNVIFSSLLHTQTENNNTWQVLRLYRHCVFQRRHNDKEHHSMRVRTACLQQIKQGLDWFLSEEWIGNVFATCSIAEGSRKWPKGPVTFKRDLLTWSSISVQITLMSCFTLLMPWIDIYVYPNSEPSWQDSGITSIHSIP